MNFDFVARKLTHMAITQKNFPSCFFKFPKVWIACPKSRDKGGRCCLAQLGSKHTFLATGQA